MKIRFALLSIFALALLMRFINLSFQSLHCDEAYIILLVRDHSIKYIFSSMAYDPRTPLYYLILNLWIKLFGGAEAQARSLTALFGSLTVFPLFFLARKYFNKTTALLAVVLFAISPFNIYCSQMVKEIALYVFFGISGYLCFLYALDRNKLLYWILFIACAAISIYFHYAAGLLIAAALVYFILTRKNYSRVVTRNAIFSFIGIFLVYLPGLWFMLKNFFVYTSYVKAYPKVLEEPTFIQLIKYGLYTFSWFIKGEIQCWAIYLGERRKDLLNILPLIFLAFVFLNRYFLRQVKSKFSSYLPIITAIIVPIALELIAARLKIIYFGPRHIAYVAAFLFILIAAAIINASKIRKVIIVLCLLIFMLVPYMLLNTYQQEPWNDSLNWLRQRYSGNDIIGLSDPNDIIFVEYYNKGNLFLSFGISYTWNYDVGPDKMVSVTKKNFEEIKATIIRNCANKKKIWLLSRGIDSHNRLPTVDPEGLVISWLDSKYALIESKRFPGKYADIQIRSYDLNKVIK